MKLLGDNAFESFWRRAALGVIVGSLTASVVVVAQGNQCGADLKGTVNSIVTSACPPSPPTYTRTVSVECVDECGNNPVILEGFVSIRGECYGDDGDVCPYSGPNTNEYSTKVLVTGSDGSRIGTSCHTTPTHVTEVDCDCDPTEKCLEPTTPVFISMRDGRYELTDVEAGVLFDIDSDGMREAVSWSRPGSDDALLALDRNGNGLVDNGEELFGNTTPQPRSEEENGFLALAVFDDSLNGGNEDGMIDAADRVYSSLVLWLDQNHNGVSERRELMPLRRGGIEAIYVDYTETERRDRFGNWFRYKAKALLTDGSLRTIWDVILLAE
jgi:hypothetical protein